MRKAQLVVSALILVLLLGSCTPVAAPAPQAPAPAPAQAKLAATTKPAWQEEWDRTLAAARNEVKLVIATSGGNEVRRVINEGIKDAYGLQAETVSGVGSELAARLAAERRAGLYLEDVYLGAAPTIANVLKPAGMLQPLDSALVLPEVTDSKLWYRGELPWTDQDHVGFAPSLFPSRAIAINTNLVKPTEVKSWRDLLDPKWKGKLALHDPTTAGAGQLAMLGLEEIMGWDYVKELAKVEPILIRDPRQALDWLAHGKISILIGPKPDTFAEFVKVGAPLASLEPVEGIWISVGIGPVALFKNAPHPNAANVFINWLLSKDGQTLFSNAVLQQSARLDVSTAGLSPDSIRQPGAKYSAGVSTEAGIARRLVTDKLAKELFEPLLKR